MSASRLLALLSGSAVLGAVLYGQRAAERHHREVLALTRAVWSRPLYPPDEEPLDYPPRLVLVRH